MSAALGAYWATRIAGRRRRFGPVFFVAGQSGHWRWESTSERICNCQPPDSMPAGVPPRLIWRCALCAAEWVWHPGRQGDE